MIEIFISAGVKARKGSLVFKSQPLTTEVLRQIGIDAFSKDHAKLADFLTKYDEAKLKELIESLRNALIPKEEEIDFTKVLFQDNPSYFYSDIRVFCDIKNSRTQGVIYPNGSVVFWESVVLAAKMKRDLGDAVAEFLDKAVIVGAKGYFPKKDELWVLEGDVMHLNLWTKPAWESFDGLTYQPSQFLEFMEYLFPDEPDRKYMFGWVRDMVDKRAGTIAILAGKPGIGKNIFVEHICKNLVGKENFSIAVRGEGKGNKFHSYMTDTRLCYFDELQLNGETRNNLKAFHNEEAAIERKGENADKPKKIHASFVVANNNPERVQLEFSDRKFFTPRLPEIPLLQEKGDSWIREFIERLSEPGYLRSIYLTCCDMGEGVTSMIAHKNETFKKFCFNGFDLTIRRIAAMLEKRPIVDSRDIRTRLLGMEISDQLSLYEESFGRPLGHYRDKGKGRWVIYAPDYIPTEDDEVSI